MEVLAVVIERQFRPRRAGSHRAVRTDRQEPLVVAVLGDHGDRGAQHAGGEYRQQVRGAVVQVVRRVERAPQGAGRQLQPFARRQPPLLGQCSAPRELPTVRRVQVETRGGQLLLGEGVAAPEGECVEQVLVAALPERVDQPSAGRLHQVRGGRGGRRTRAVGG